MCVCVEYQCSYVDEEEGADVFHVTSSLGRHVGINRDSVLKPLVNVRALK